MDREEAQTLLNAKLDEYRQLSYDQLATRVGDEEFPEIAGPSGSRAALCVYWGQSMMEVGVPSCHFAIPCS